MPHENYTFKFIILFLATFAGVFAIWFALIREESADWVSSLVAHQVSPYAVTEADGGVIINNVVMGYEFSLPKGFKTLGARNLSFYLEAAGEKKCEVRHYYLKSEQVSENETKIVLSAKRGKLVFELVDASEIKNCGKYLMGIKNSLALVIFD